jgi:alginate O-acetyltransferase complex protein AlgI
VVSAQAWLGALSYSLQIYFDFSGYSDMAIGLALMMGITFPLNFLSPYKATSLIEFWRRWNITLSRFLRDYLYIFLGGNRRGIVRRYLNLLITMVLGGLWHGASWNFIIWGALHGAGLAVNHAIHDLSNNRLRGRLHWLIGFLLTQIFVVIAWVPFRATTLASTLQLWASMIGHVGESATVPILAPTLAWITVVISGAIALLLPNTAEIFGRIGYDKFTWKANWQWSIALGCAFGVAIGLSLTQPTTFLYYQF